MRLKSRGEPATRGDEETRHVCAWICVCNGGQKEDVRILSEFVAIVANLALCRCARVHRGLACASVCHFVMNGHYAQS